MTQTLHVLPLADKNDQFQLALDERCGSIFSTFTSVAEPNEGIILRLQPIIFTNRLICLCVDLELVWVVVVVFLA